MAISENLHFINSQLPANVKLVAVSKTKGADLIMEAYLSGQRRFGENKVQELISKWEELPRDIEWHFIGHLQSNKVKYLVPFVSMIHGVDSLKLLAAINREAEKCSRVIPVLLEFHIASEESKFGLSLPDAEAILNSSEMGLMNNITICGVMGMATYTDNVQVIRSEFARLRSIFDDLKQKYFSGSDHFCELSMGMSDDYPIAISEGSTIVRIGSKLFGMRANCQSQ